MIENKGYSNPAPDEVPKDSEYRSCLIKFDAPDTSGASPAGKELWPGDNTPRTFIDCNLINVAPPPGSTLIRTNATVAEYGIPAGSDTLTVDGALIHTTNYIVNRTYGRYDDSANYVEFGTPIETPPKRERT